MIFDVVVGAAFEKFGNLGPAITMLLMGFEHQLFFFGRPGLFVNGGVEVVVPSRSEESYLSRHCLPER
jgi:hypothetical protein